ncbi:MAG: adenosylmethionine--8-amino-7-oxononanoate transaminase [Nitrospirae bacterium]|nr:adenosylmethionine--8-amino-7-oxononanoate transaminase [Nitrospirota bacterium]
MKKSARTRHLATQDRLHIWHPFTQHSEWNAQDPLLIERARGNYLFDSQGRRYLDGVSSLWCNVHGHAVPEIVRAVRDQVGRLDHSTLLGLTHPAAIELSRELVRLAPPGLTKVFYSDSGSTAAEIALKMAYQYWQQTPATASVPEPKRKTKFLTLGEGYHGDTIGSVSLGGIDLFHATYRPLLFPTVKAPAPYCFRCPVGHAGMSVEAFSAALFGKSKAFEGRRDLPCRFACLQAADDLIRAHHAELAAVFLEPLVQGAAGILVHPPGYLRRLRELCTEHDVLLIVDEVATGFGRTGRMFAVSHEEVSPDLMCLGKGLTGGVLPLAATLTTETIYNAFVGPYEEYRTFFHGHTYTGNPIACAAALANLRLFRKNRLLRSLPAKIRLLHSSLFTLSSSQFVGEIRQRGLMVGIELVKDRTTREPFPARDRIGHRVCMKARDYGVIIRPLGDVIVLMPPLSMTPVEIRKLVASTRDAISAVLG